MRIGNFMTLKENMENQSLMIHLFESNSTNSTNLKHLIAIKLSMEQLIAMKCSTQRLHFYDGLQQKR